MPMPPTLDTMVQGQRKNVRMSSSIIDVQTTEAPPSLTIWMKSATGVMPCAFATASSVLNS